MLICYLSAFFCFFSKCILHYQLQKISSVFCAEVSNFKNSLCILSVFLLFKVILHQIVLNSRRIQGCVWFPEGVTVVILKHQTGGKCFGLLRRHSRDQELAAGLYLFSTRHLHGLVRHVPPLRLLEQREWSQITSGGAVMNLFIEKLEDCLIFAKPFT